MSDHMTGIEAGWRLPIAQSHRTVCDAGPLVFVGGAGDFGDAGRIAHPGDFDAQVRGTLANVAAALGQRGCALADVVRLKAFYKSDGDRDEWAVMAALRRAFDADLAPAITPHPVPLQAFTGQEIQLQAMASKGWRDGPELRSVEAPVPERVAAMFDRPRITRGLRAGEFIAVPGFTAIDDQGRPLAAGQGIEQTDMVMAGIEATLAALGMCHQGSLHHG